jgi:predicted negative regulator of RcsB-dependent stress response
VTHNKIGDVLVAKGNLAEALHSYRDSLAIMDRLAKSDPSNAGWQRDLSVSYNKIGDVLLAQGNVAEALASYREDLAIASRLAATDPSRPRGQPR